jgi:hypothetical protein
MLGGRTRPSAGERKEHMIRRLMDASAGTLLRMWRHCLANVIDQRLHVAARLWRCSATAQLRNRPVRATRRARPAARMQGDVLKLSETSEEAVKAAEATVAAKTGTGQCRACEGRLQGPLSTGRAKKSGTRAQLCYWGNKTTLRRPRLRNSTLRPQRPRPPSMLAS